MSVSTAAAWRHATDKIRRKDAVALELPSGATVVASRPQIESWLVRGRMPESLAAAVLAVSGDQPRRLTGAEIAELSAFNRSIVKAAIVEPRVVDGAAGDGEISFAEIPDADVDFILAWARRAPEVADLEAFRQRAGLSPAGDDGADVRAAAERDAGGH